MKKRKHQTSLNEERARQIKERINKRKQKTKDFTHPEKFVESYRK
jgi:large subunit ribosomal protein L7e